jgi:hypothetical protein
LWIRILAEMARNGGRFIKDGTKPDTEAVAKICDCTFDEAAKLGAELLKAGVPSKDADGIWINRRMVREARRAEQHSLESCMELAKHPTVAMAEKEVLEFWANYAAVDWIDATGRKIADVRAAMIKWKIRQSSHGKKYAEEATPAWRKLELLEEADKEFTARNPSPERWTPEQIAERKTRRAEIARLKKEMTQ